MSTPSRFPIVFNSEGTKQSINTVKIIEKILNKILEKFKDSFKCKGSFNLPFGRIFINILKEFFKHKKQRVFCDFLPSSTF